MWQNALLAKRGTMSRRKRARGGSVDYLVAEAALPEGPRSVEELATWPSQIAEVACGPPEHSFPAPSPVGWEHRRASTEAVLRGGIVLETDFSGKGCAECSMAALMLGYKQAGLSVPDTPLVLWRACDRSQACQRVFLQSDRGPAHVFSDMIGRLPTVHQQAIIALRPAPGASASEAANAYAEQAEYLDRHFDDCFGIQVMAGNCLKHPGDRCSVVYRPTSQEGADSGGHACSSPPLRVNISGPMCTPWSLFGARRGLSSPHTESWNLWLRRMRAEQADIITMENVPTMPQAMFRDQLSRTHIVLSAVLGPEDLGRPERRRRLFCTAVSRETCVWLGPETAEESAKLFIRMFSRRVVLEGDIYAGLDSPECIANAKYNLFGRGPGVFGPSAKHLPLRQLLVGGVRDRYDGFREQMLSDEGRFGSAFIADLSQTPGRRSRGSQWVPTLTTSSTLVCMSRDDHVFSPAELSFSQGWPTLTPWSHRYRDALLFDTSVLSAWAQSSMAGNGMHLVCIAAWHAFVFAHIARRDVGLPRVRPSSCPRSDEAEDVDGFSIV